MCYACERLSFGVDHSLTSPVKADGNDTGVQGTGKEEGVHSDACVTHGEPPVGRERLGRGKPPLMPRHLFPQVC